MQIGGGELVQVAWFDINSQGVKNPKVMSTMVGLIGQAIQDDSKTIRLINSLYKGILSKQPELSQNKDFKECLVNTFTKTKHSIEQFIKTNIPNLNLSNGFDLDFNGSSILVSIRI